MEKTKPAVLRSLEDGYNKACNAYVVELARAFLDQQNTEQRVKG